MLPCERIWPFNLNFYFFQHKSLCMGSTLKRPCLYGKPKWAFLYCLLCTSGPAGDFGAFWQEKNWHLPLGLKERKSSLLHLHSFGNPEEYYSVLSMHILESNQSPWLNFLNI
jgi:hypothetical protein